LGSADTGHPIGPVDNYISRLIADKPRDIAFARKLIAVAGDRGMTPARYANMIRSMSENAENRAELPAAPAPDGVLEAAVYVDDLDAAARFYGGILALEEIRRVAGRHVFYRVGASVLLVFDPQATKNLSPNPALPVPPHGATGPGHVCLSASAEALDSWAARLVAAGVAIEADFRWPNGARSIYVRDFAGNSVELAEPKLWF
jgi:catechol 2,3-dioxygenase-like lactoylglutathione lyase family enzyme